MLMFMHVVNVEINPTIQKLNTKIDTLVCIDGVVAVLVVLLQSLEVEDWEYSQEGFV